MTTKSWRISKRSLLLNLLIWVAFFLGKVSFDLKVHPASLKLKHQDLKDSSRTPTSKLVGCSEMNDGKDVYLSLVIRSRLQGNRAWQVGWNLESKNIVNPTKPKFQQQSCIVLHHLESNLTIVPQR